MFEKILIATDFSEASDCLLQCVAEFKALGLKEVVLAHVIYVSNSPGLEHKLEADMRPELERQTRQLEEQGLEVRAELRFGVPARELDRLAEEQGASMILIGSRGRSLVKSLLGGTSSRLIQEARRPVFLSRINVTGEGESCSVSVCKRSFENILFTTNFSDVGERSFALLQDIVRAHNSKATLLHVMDQDDAEINPSGKDRDHQRANDERRLEEMRQRLAKPDDQIRIELATGKPAEEIIERTRTGEYSLVVIGNHGKGFLREALLGSVANSVVRQAETPVLLVPSVD